ncbi:MAG: ABC transporter ATP-binding protein [Myxococcota bacterium]|nr:ABC transporter ATP-binding protein [Myxococcota bacterium]
MTSGIEIARLTKAYGSFVAVSELSLAVSPGEIFALLGPNGAGKTTTIKMMIGVLQPSGGSARICGLDCFSARADVMRHVGYLPDEPVFYDYLRGRELLRFVGEMHGLTRTEIEQRTAPLAERLKLEEALEDYAVNYSKGMKKKLALIAALLHDPSVLILDEPTNGLDPFATRALHELLIERAAGGKLVFYSTHLLDQAERLCKRVGILFKGKLAALGEIAELRANLSAGGSLEDVFFAVAAESGG